MAKQELINQFKNNTTMRVHLSRKERWQMERFMEELTGDTYDENEQDEWLMAA